MKLKDFVAETLNEIIDGVMEAQTHYQGKGGSVNPDTLSSSGSPEGKIWDRSSKTYAQKIDFDVAVTTSEGTEARGGVGIFVGPIGLGSQGKLDASNISYNRIRFSIPIVLPSG